MYEDLVANLDTKKYTYLDSRPADQFKGNPDGKSLTKCEAVSQVCLNFLLASYLKPLINEVNPRWKVPTIDPQMRFLRILASYEVKTAKICNFLFLPYN